MRGAEGEFFLTVESTGRGGEGILIICFRWNLAGVGREERFFFKWDGGGYLFFNFAEQSYSCGLTENQSCNLLKNSRVGGLNQIIVLKKKERWRPGVRIIKFNGKGGGLNHSILLEKEVEEGGGYLINFVLLWWLNYLVN